MKTCPVVIARLVLFGVLAATPLCWAQWSENPATGSPPQRVPDRTFMAGQTGLRPLLRAELVDEHKNAKQHKAVVKVETDSVQIVDPAQANYAPRLDQAHLQYQEDRGETINTTATTWTFENLSPGEHHIRIMLAGNDYHTQGEETTLKIHIP